MSLQSDLKNHADNALEVALEQGRQAVEQGKRALEAAEAALGKLQGNITGAKAFDSIGPNIEALRSAVEPFVAAALGYTAQLSNRAESTVSDLKADRRVAQVIQTGEALAAAVVEAVQERVGRATGTARTGSSSSQSGPAPAAPSAPSAHAPAKQAAPAKAAAKTTPAKKVTPAKAAKSTTTAVKKAAPAKATKTATKAPAKRTAKRATPQNDAN
jgi:hypothetical protein